jgi:hypothetical protein
LTRERPRADSLVPLLLTGLALGFRLSTISLQPLSADEAMHLQPLGFWEMVHLDLAFNPPLFRLLVRLSTLFSPTAAAARFVPLAAGVATIPVLYFVARRHLTPMGATFATLLLAIHPWHIRHSQTVRAYALLTLLWLLSVAHTCVVADASPESTGRAQLLRHMGIALLLLLTHYLGFILLAIEVVVLLLHRQWRYAFSLSGLMAGVAVALAPLLAFGTAEKITGSSVAYTSGLPFLAAELQSVATPGGLSLLAVWSLAGAGLATRRLRLPATLTLSLLLAVPLLGLAMPIEVRYALPALPLVLLLAGGGASRLLASPGQIRRAGTILIMLLAALGIAYLIPTYYRAPEDPRPAAERHRDLVHEAAPFSRLVDQYRSRQSDDVTLPMVLVGRGRVEHQVLYHLGGGRYPTARVQSSGDRTRNYAGVDFQLMVHESPTPPREACPQWPEPPFVLLFEAPLSCDLPATCQPVDSAVRFYLYDCSVRSHTEERVP